ncbi:hypothetical protein N825_20625 [Skermanella stibiiresistens SB22]|uniref:General stress protein 17M-like domain-containing protein n=1 Tax=Skermanella stibiiresistens SB22 TaxID=1385369 RepID=W9GXX8_9PROT|nr:hypothetical protein [Skermanella stibiiresistens]EWY37302.1 hypothetical protein N825_20625 [Skermanella stibiiresistens SB22]
MEEAHLVAEYGNPETAQRVRRDLDDAGFGADRVKVLSSERDIGDLPRETGISPATAQRAADGLRRGGSVVLVHATVAEGGRVRAILERYEPGGIDRLAETYLEPGWSRADEVAGPDGVLEIADDLLNVKKPGEDPSKFRPLAPSPDEPILERPDTGKAET